MANPNPNPLTRFGARGDAANPSRSKQKGARDRLSAAFLTDFADDYEVHGKAVIEIVRDRDPIAYMRLAAALLPTRVEVSEDPISCLSERALECLGVAFDPALSPAERLEAIQAYDEAVAKGEG